MSYELTCALRVRFFALNKGTNAASSDTHKCTESINALFSQVHASRSSMCRSLAA